MIPYGRQEVLQADIDAVVGVLRSDFLTQGPAVPQFEQLIASRVNAQYATAVNSGTSALHIACLALGVGADDVLWTVPNTFVASANCARFCGAGVDFVDIDPDTFNLSVRELRTKLSRAKDENRLPKVLVPVHFAGQPTEQEAIWELAQEFGFKVLEDASHSIGATRNGEPVGSCRWSDITVFSFHAVKIFTTGEGGMALTNDAELAQHMELVRSHGITRDPDRFSSVDRGASPGPPAWHYEQQMLGFNYRMTDIQAALGASQLERLDGSIDRRNALADRYGESLQGLPLQLPSVRSENRSAFHLYVVHLKPETSTQSHRDVFDALKRGGIGVNLHYPPVHLQPYYREMGFGPGQYPVAEGHGECAITLPLYAAMSDEQQDEVVHVMRRVLCG